MSRAHICLPHLLVIIVVAFMDSLAKLLWYKNSTVVITMIDNHNICALKAFQNFGILTQLQYLLGKDNETYHTFSLTLMISIIYNVTSMYFYGICKMQMDIWFPQSIT